MDKKTTVSLTSGVLRYTTGFFHEQGFLQLMPVMLSPITDPLGPDPGSSVIKTGEIEYLGQSLCLTQSMILHKQIAVKEGLDRLFIISPNVRLEHPGRKDTGKHLFEFSQVDFEIAHAKMDDVFTLMERYLEGLSGFLLSEYGDALSERKFKKISGPFERIETGDLSKKYGADWEIPASMEAEKPFWAISHKREFYDMEDPECPGKYLNYDLIYPEGYGEGLSGAQREFEYGRIMSRIERDGLDKSRYSSYLDIAKTGFVPSAGGGFGVERLMRYVTGSEHVGDVQLFRRVPGEQVLV